MRNLAQGNSEMQGRICNLGGIELVLKAMKLETGTSSEVQETVEIAMKALRNLIAGNTDNAKKVSSLGGIETLVKAMQAHTDVVDVQKAGCGVVWNLAAGSAELKLEITRHGGVETVLHAMEAHPTSTEVQECGCLDLYLLGADQIGRCIDVVMRAMREHHTARCRQRAALRCATSPMAPRM